MLYNESEIKISVNNDIEELIRNYAKELPVELQGKITIQGNKSIQKGDCTLDWGKGMVRKQQDFLFKEIDNILANYFHDK